MKTVINYDDFPNLVGQELALSDWMLVDQQMIDDFARVTHDHQWIHTDVERAEREMGGTIAHGFLTISLMSHLSTMSLEVTGVSRAINYGFNKLRFTGAVQAGSRIRLRQSVVEVKEKAGGLMVTRATKMEVEGKPRPVMTSEWVGFIYR